MALSLVTTPHDPTWKCQGRCCGGSFCFPWPTIIHHPCGIPKHRPTPTTHPVRGAAREKSGRILDLHRHGGSYISKCRRSVKNLSATPPTIPNSSVTPNPCVCFSSLLASRPTAAGRRSSLLPTHRPSRSSPRPQSRRAPRVTGPGLSGQRPPRSTAHTWLLREDGLRVPSGAIP